MKKDEQHKDRDWVQFLAVRRGWVGIALFMFCILVSVYGGMAISYHLSKGWTGYETVRAIVVDITTAIPTAAAIPVLVLFLGVEVPMILYNWVMEQIDERQQKREAIGKEIGKEIADREWAEWYARRQAAEAAGEDFNEPTPGEKRNGAPEDK